MVNIHDHNNYDYTIVDYYYHHYYYYMSLLLYELLLARIVSEAIYFTVCLSVPRAPDAPLPYARDFRACRA